MNLFQNKYVTSVKNLFKHNIEELPNNKTLGTQREQLAIRFLKKKGYKILQRNYRCKIGEIDIVCYDHGTVAFVEVKTRFSDKFGSPELSVTEAKKRQIVKVALHYVAKKKIEDINLRFDVVSIFYPPTEKHPTITLFKNAFTKDELFVSRT